ncbi:MULTISPECIES: hypothetical protein [unclassified Methylobacterium]|uniref:hypothetical protein n=1 Tax=unclassified Methylobacterium TaxID=2615210 RepID=UPI00089F2665|nr:MULTISPECIES: hypothetical protein [unclassified Methylobacterium]SEF68819.1 hypothetical protein SAMN04488144_103297 [Methylobacterium sp. 190mf]SFT25475.1 hypothetical protein SAMN04487845_13224 [Methylobacterium sp. yr668]
MAEYHVTTYPPHVGPAEMALVARRVDTAGARFVGAVVAVLDSLSLRDTEGGWRAYRAAIAAAGSLRRGAVAARLTVAGGYVVLVERVA